MRVFTQVASPGRHRHYQFTMVAFSHPLWRFLSLYGALYAGFGGCSREFPRWSFIPTERCRGPQENSGRIGGFEKGEFERHSARKEVAALICVRRADTVQLRAQEIDEPTKIRIVVQRDPLGERGYPP